MVGVDFYPKMQKARKAKRIETITKWYLIIGVTFGLGFAFLQLFLDLSN